MLMRGVNYIDDNFDKTTEAEMKIEFKDLSEAKKGDLNKVKNLGKKQR